MKLIKFYTRTCVPCKMMEPIIEKIIQNYPNINYEPIDCTEGVPEEWEKEIRSVPTILIEREGQITKIVGVKTYEYLEKLINE